MGPTGISGENSPVWLSAGLVAVGMMSWLGAFVSAPSIDDGPPASPVQSAEPEELRPPTPVRTPPPTPELTAEPQAQPERDREPCAPIVELQFTSGSSDPTDAAALEEVVTAASRFTGHKIVVEGYASTTGSPHHNLRLSHRRADRAKADLVAAGLPEERVRVQAFGEYRPNIAGDSERDRRVVIRLEGVPSCPESQGDE